MGLQFKRATKTMAKLRLALDGPSGSGKTYSALAIASGLGKRIAVIDTERGSASLYANDFSFDVIELSEHHPERYIEAIRAAEEAGYDVLVIDSLSHAWMGKHGALELVDNAAKKSRSGNSFTAWREVTPLHNALVDAMLQSKCHIIVTMRAKTEWVLDEDKNGKKTPRKVGMAAIQRDGMEYEMTIVGDLDLDHSMVISKTRWSALAGQVIAKPDAKLGERILAWLNDAAPSGPVPAARTVQSEAPAETAAQASARLREELNALATLFGGRERLLKACSVEAWPTNLGQAKALVERAKQAHTDSIDFNDPPSTDDAPFEEEAASATESQPPGRPPPEQTPPPPSVPLRVVGPSNGAAEDSRTAGKQTSNRTDRSPADGAEKPATVQSATKDLSRYVSEPDFWARSRKAGRSGSDSMKSDLSALFGVSEVRLLSDVKRTVFLMLLEDAKARNRPLSLEDVFADVEPQFGVRSPEMSDGEWDAYLSQLNDSHLAKGARR